MFPSHSDAANFNKLLRSIKTGQDIDDGANSQFDERTEEASAEQYFQVLRSILNALRTNLSFFHLVLRLSGTTAEYDAGLHPYIYLSTSYSGQLC
jgi:hypothetical protein